MIFINNTEEAQRKREFITDPQTGKIIACFEFGKCEVKDDKIAERLISLGYEAEEEKPKTKKTR